MQIIPIRIEKEVEPADDLAELILSSTQINDGDILVIAQKIISKQEGRTVDLSTIRPSLLSEGIASQYQKDPRIVELIMSETKRIVRMKNGIIIVETNSGFVCANAGVDESNVQDGHATLLPVDSDAAARAIRGKIKDKTGRDVGIIISDTFGRPFRMGQANCAIGISGLDPILDYAGTLDIFKKPLRITEIAVADELSGAAELVMGKALMCPVALIRGYSFEGGCHTTVSELIRPEGEDLFK